MTKPSTANGGFPSVVVTAVTATTSIAPDIESTWKGLLAGESGIRVLEDEFVTQSGTCQYDRRSPQGAHRSS